MKKTNFTLIFISILILLSPKTDIVSAQNESVNREDVLWCAGYWAGPDHWNPVGWGGGQSWGAFFMYIPMFDFNYQTNRLIPLIGETMEWNDDGSELHVKLWDEAVWSDGEPITSQDVYWNFELLYDPGQWAGAYSARVASFTIVDDKNFYLTMKPEYYYSRDIWFRFAGGAYILPQHIWDEIATEKGGYPINGSGLENSFQVSNDKFSNNWLDEDFPEEWKVASGPYEPYFVSETKDKQMYKRIDNWWGDGILTPNFDKMPPYIGQLHYASNFAMNAAYAADQIDWFGAYYPRIWELMESNPNIHAWSDEPPYFPPISAIIEFAPNHMRYPFDQKWLREVFALAINYDDLSIVSASGYLEKARIGFVDDRSPTQDHLFNQSIEDTFAIDYDPNEAKNLLAEHCFQYSGIWYTKNSTDQFGQIGSGGTNIVDQLPTISDDPETTVDESVWSAELNVRIGGYEIEVISGWSDSMMQASLLSTYLSDIGIDATPKYVEYSTFISDNVAEGNGDYDLMLWGIGFAPTNEIYQGFSKIAGPYNTWTNVTGWYNPEFAQIVRDLEVTPSETPEEKTLVDRAQFLIASEIPSVPIAPNGYWYAFNNKYWEGWPTEVNPYIQPIAPWAVDRSGSMLYILMRLSSTSTNSDDDSTDDDSTDDDTNRRIPGFNTGLVLISTMGIITVVIYTSKRK